MSETFEGTISLYFKSLRKCNSYYRTMKRGQITQNAQIALDD